MRRSLLRDEEDEGALTGHGVRGKLSLVVITQRLSEVVMFKISGPYSDDVAAVVARLNEASKTLENYTIDGDTQGTIMKSFREINRAASETLTCLLDLKNRLNDIVYSIKSGNEHE